LACRFAIGLRLAGCLLGVPARCFFAGIRGCVAAGRLLFGGGFFPLDLRLPVFVDVKFFLALHGWRGLARPGATPLGLN
jgi:hypothetical protein